ncbi:hypothetical protein PUNSTDRAFT_130501 [Punctularia strigosozonata HHB-11173 SS5]|uniref:uncharacterized protein n=1 Tax=Punctularia strigosozonata (strain HHB-11173) TaxID=741275 RepID=UPI00044171B8|nr:uncharacterized protein PUNSTDRAFT_130501 [Punctularia strigosozonata HHB-11173 SS5]EIN12232.1 hypothetical protein PUNSTDRAFT_130501 [Punctularia strigosozonata HHB-11173 SS5]
MAARPLDMKMLRPKANSLGHGYERCDDYAYPQTGQAFVERSMREAGHTVPHEQWEHTLRRRPHDERTGLALHRPLFLINALDEPYEDRIGLLMNALSQWLTESRYFNSRLDVVVYAPLCTFEGDADPKQAWISRALSTTQAPFKGPELRDVVKSPVIGFGSCDESERSTARGCAQR